MVKYSLGRQVDKSWADTFSESPLDIFWRHPLIVLLINVSNLPFHHLKILPHMFIFLIPQCLIPQHSHSTTVANRNPMAALHRKVHKSLHKTEELCPPFCILFNKRFIIVSYLAMLQYSASPRSLLLNLSLKALI